MVAKQVIPDKCLTQCTMYLFLVLSLFSIYCNCKTFDFINTSDFDAQFPNSQLVNLSVPRPYGIYVAHHLNPVTNKPMRVAFLEHSLISLRPNWAVVHPIRNVFSPIECELVIQAAEDYASNNGGWKTKRHNHYPTTDLPLKDIFPPQMGSDIIGTIRSMLFPSFESLYNVNVSEFYIADLFVAKYDADTDSQVQKELTLHKDMSPWSFVISLNEGFEGGGTYFEDTHEIYQVAVGHSIIFNGKHKHAGV